MNKYELYEEFNGKDISAESAKIFWKNLLDKSKVLYHNLRYELIIPDKITPMFAIKADIESELSLDETWSKIQDAKIIN